jgi:3-methyladenine DNA glycosylase AlkD
MKLDENNPQFNAMQNVKRRFFALRNGIIADTLRKAGDPHHVIFGLTLPQLVEVAQATGQNKDLAQMLWDNQTTRESRLIAPMLMPVAEFTIDDANTYISQVQCVEEADILCHRLLRSTNFAFELIEKYSCDGMADMQRYLAIRLIFNLVAKNPKLAANIATAEINRNCSLTLPVAKSLAEESEFYLS